MTAMEFPESENAIVVRSDFSDDAAWRSLCGEMRVPIGDFRACVDFVDRREFAGVTVEQLVSLAAHHENITFVFVADHVTFTDPARPLLVVDLLEEPGRTFRAVPRAVQAVENNLSIANMDFHEYAEAVDDDGIFRGFPRP
ncbi:MAG: hypothetical protein QUV05_06075 [Phycisphaerae bacterium]|nr:hypothetical protein [Phycisphaerae bacterium]